jgi:diguanylate cyclase (GGDEF)-like protein
LRSASPDFARRAVAAERGAGAPQAPNQAVAGEEARRLLKSARRVTLIVAAAYLYDTLLLFGFWAAGFVDIGVPVGAFFLLGALVGAIDWAHTSGWSLGRRDPTLFLPHQLFATAIVLGVALLAPQIAFQPFATLFAISAFSFMAPNARSLVIAWVAVAIGAVAVIFAVGPQMAIPTSTLAGEALTGAVVAGLLARCIWIALFVHQLRRRLAEKNVALGKAMERLAKLADIDELTGLPNRRAIAEILRRQMALSRRAGLPFSLAYIDIDRFKTINEVHGHLAGDGALRSIASALCEAVRESDRIGRFGGEEFLLVMTGTTLQDAGAPLERLRQRIADLGRSELDLAPGVTITIGAAQYAPGETLEALVRRAGLALHLAKGGGRNRVAFNPPVEGAEPLSRALRA